MTVKVSDITFEIAPTEPVAANPVTLTFTFALVVFTVTEPIPDVPADPVAFTVSLPVSDIVTVTVPTSP